MIDVEPLKPIKTSLYFCDSKFHVEALLAQLGQADKYGFIVMDGNGALFGTLCGSEKVVLHRMSVELPNKHGRGGQSALRFARLRLEKRHNYVTKVAEAAAQTFLAHNRLAVKGLVLAGAADLKHQLLKADRFDPRLAAHVVAVVDVAYGGESGFNEALALAAPVLASSRLVQERAALKGYFEEVARDSGLASVGREETQRALEAGAVQRLLVWHALPLLRLRLRHPSTGEEKVVLRARPDVPRSCGAPRRADKQRAAEHAEQAGMEELERVDFVEWVTVNRRALGVDVELVSDASVEGAQFARGFGGLGALLRYPCPLPAAPEYDAPREDRDACGSESESEYGSDEEAGVDFM
mmetsp:Transcript_54916/g.128392  ORF Transcript_54916/g.128392 Transcript_54916/m.128392 type:complete len:354 (-) Transcript_54916:908-1969(-)